MSGTIYMAEKNQIVNGSSIIPASQFIDDSVVPQFLELKNGIFPQLIDVSGSSLRICLKLLKDKCAYFISQEKHV